MRIICQFKSKLSIFIAAYQFSSDLKFVRIHFDTSMFDRITKENTKSSVFKNNCFMQDRAAKFVDKLSAIGRITVNYIQLDSSQNVLMIFLFTIIFL